MKSNGLFCTVIANICSVFFHPMLGMKPGALNILDRVGLMPSTLSSFKCLPENKEHTIRKCAAIFQARCPGLCKKVS